MPTRVMKRSARRRYSQSCRRSRSVLARSDLPRNDRFFTCLRRRPTACLGTPGGDDTDPPPARVRPVQNLSKICPKCLDMTEHSRSSVVQGSWQPLSKWKIQKAQRFQASGLQCHSHSIINRSPIPAWLKGLAVINIGHYRHFYRKKRASFAGAGDGAICGAATLTTPLSTNAHRTEYGTKLQPSSA